MWVPLSTQEQQLPHHFCYKKAAQHSNISHREEASSISNHSLHETASSISNHSLHETAGNIRAVLYVSKLTTNVVIWCSEDAKTLMRQLKLLFTKRACHALQQHPNSIVITSTLQL